MSIITVKREKKRKTFAVFKIVMMMILWNCEEKNKEPD